MFVKTISRIGLARGYMFSLFLRCVYGDCDNDVSDHQTVNFRFGPEGATATLTMVAFTPDIRRDTKVGKCHLLSLCVAKKNTADYRLV